MNVATSSINMKTLPVCLISGKSDLLEHPGRQTNGRVIQRHTWVIGKTNNILLHSHLSDYTVHSYVPVHPLSVSLVLENISHLYVFTDCIGFSPLDIDVSHFLQNVHKLREEWVEHVNLWLVSHNERREVSPQHRRQQVLGIIRWQGHVWMKTKNTSVNWAV